MELLLALLAELLAVLTIAGAILCVAIALAALAALVLGLFGRRVATSRLRRGLRRAAIITIAAVTLALVLAQTVAAPALLRRALASVAAERGLHLTFEDAELSLLRGALRLRNARLDRGEALALAGERVAIDVDWPSLLLGDRIRVEKLDLHGVTGRVHQSGALRLPKIPATIDHLTLSAIDVAFARGGGDPHRLTIKELSVAPLRSDQALFDLLLATSGRLKIDAFDVEVRRAPGLTTWSILGVPTAILGVELPPALRGLEALALDLEIAAEHDEPIGDDAHLEVTLGVAAARGDPGRDSEEGRARRIAGALTRVARAAGFGELRFALTIDAAALRGQTSLDESALHHALHAALAGALRRWVGR